jgi:hypothetical protein
MDAALLQQKIYGGYAKAALRIGPTHTLYRPNGAGNPIVPSNVVTTLAASFNAEDMAYAKPRGYGQAVWYCLADGTQIHVGDYLVNAGNGLTYFIAAMQETLPILAVQCNRAVRIGRMPAGNGAGYVGYAGVVQSEESDALGAGGTDGTFGSGWPASILLGGAADGHSLLPSGVRQSCVTILLPASVPLAISESDVIQDDMGRDYAIASAELSALGWRIAASEEHS